MLKLRLILFFGGLGVILGEPGTGSDYSYQSADSNYGLYSGYGNYGGYGLMAVPQPGYTYAQPSYTTYAQPPYFSSFYPAYGVKAYPSQSSCNYMKVIEILDQIFCEYGNKKRYSSTIYSEIDTVVDQLEYSLECVFFQSTFDYLEAAIQTLNTLQDTMYTTYYDSSLLSEYCESCDEVESSSTSSAGTASTAGTSAKGSGSGKTAAANKLEAVKTKQSMHDTRSQTFKTNKAIKMQKTGSSASTAGSQKTTMTSTVTSTKTQSHQSHHPSLDQTEQGSTRRQRAGNFNVTMEKLSQMRSSPEKEQKVNKLRKRMAQINADRISSRKIRSYNYPDYTCALITATADCDSDKYDELLYNILERIFTALDFIDMAADETWDFIDEIDCIDEWDRWALEEASISFGEIILNFYTLLDVAITVERMYELVEINYEESSETSYRAGGSSSSSSSQPSGSQPGQPQPGMMAVPFPMTMTMAPAPRRPMAVPMMVSRTSSQPTRFMAQPQQQPQSMAMPQQQQQQQQMPQPIRMSRKAAPVAVPIPSSPVLVSSPRTRPAPAQILLVSG